MKKIYITFLLLVCTATLFSMDLPDPGSLVGIHWKTHTIPTFSTQNGRLTAAQIVANPDLNMTDYAKIAMFASTGMNCIAYKLEDGGQMTSDFPGAIDPDDKSVWNKLTNNERNILNNARAKGAYDFAKAAAAWNEANPEKKVYIVLFTRKWFQSNGVEIAGNMADAAQIFADVINRCVTDNCDQAIVGVHAVETRLNAMNDLLPFTLRFADELNLKTNNWLKGRMLFASGLGMGIAFKGYRASNEFSVATIDNCQGSDTFWNEIQQKCAGFSWTYKHYPKYDNEPSLNKYVQDYGVEMNSFANSLNMVRSVFGLDDLSRFVKRASGPMYDNVLFWGDASDGIRNLSNNVRDAIKACWIRYQFHAASFYHFTNQYGTYETVWADKNSLYTIENNQLGENSSLALWQKFLDGNVNNPFNSNNNLNIPTSIHEKSVGDSYIINALDGILIVKSTVGEPFDCQVRGLTGKLMAKASGVYHEMHLRLPKGIFVLEIRTRNAQKVCKIIM